MPSVPFALETWCFQSFVRPLSHQTCNITPKSIPLTYAVRNCKWRMDICFIWIKVHPHQGPFGRIPSKYSNVYSSNEYAILGTNNYLDKWNKVVIHFAMILSLMFIYKIQYASSFQLWTNKTGMLRSGKESARHWTRISCTNNLFSLTGSFPESSLPIYDFLSTVEAVVYIMNYDICYIAVLIFKNVVGEVS